MTILEIRKNTARARALLVFAIVLILPRASADSSAQAWALKFPSNNRAESLVAQAYAVHDGVDALAQLDKIARTRDPDLQQRIRVVAELMLLKTVSPDEMQKYRNIWRLLKRDLRRASLPYQTLAGRKDYDSGATGLPLPESPRFNSSKEEGPGTFPLSEPRKAVKQLLALRGFAVPVALDLLKDKQPGSRMYGVEILGSLDAVGQLPVLRRLLNDDGHIVVSHGCTWEQTTVGANSRYWLGMGGPSATDLEASPPSLKQYFAYAFEAEGYLSWLLDSVGIAPYDVINRLDREAKTRQAVSWDDYWSRAQPVLEVALAKRPD